MKSIYLFILLIAGACSSAPDKEQIIFKDGIGSLKLGMSLADVEKLLGSKLITTKNYLDSLNGTYEDTAQAVYNSIPLQLEFHRSYNNANNFYLRLIGIRSSSSLCKTASGIGIGSDKLKIISYYDSCHIKIQPGYVSYFNTEEGKEKSTLSIFDDNENSPEGDDTYTIVFYLFNKKVNSFELKAKLKE